MISIFSLWVLFGWQSLSAEISVPNIEIEEDKLVLNPNKGQWLLDGKAYSGFAVKLYPDGSLKEKKSFYKGKKEGLVQKWDMAGTLRYEAKFSSNKREGVSKAWSEDGVLVSESNFLNGVVHGVQRKWYPSGKIFKKMNIVNGQEEDLQQVWWENGKLYVNYEAKNGRIFGLKRSALCYELQNEIVQK